MSMRRMMRVMRRCADLNLLLLLPIVVSAAPDYQQDCKGVCLHHAQEHCYRFQGQSNFSRRAVMPCLHLMMKIACGLRCSFEVQDEEDEDASPKSTVIIEDITEQENAKARSFTTL